MTMMIKNEFRLAMYAALVASMPNTFEEVPEEEQDAVTPWVYVKYNRQRLVLVTGELLLLELYRDGEFICATHLDTRCDVNTVVELGGFEAKMKVRLM